MVKRKGHEAEHSPLLPRLKMYGAISPLPRTPLWRAQGWPCHSILPCWCVTLRCWQHFGGCWSLLRSDAINVTLNLRILIAIFNIILTLRPGRRKLVFHCHRVLTQLQLTNISNLINCLFLPRFSVKCVFICPLLLWRATCCAHLIPSVCLSQ